MRTWDIIFSALLFLVGVAADLPPECITKFEGSCNVGETTINLESKDLTNDDIEQCLGACLDEAGRGQILKIDLDGNSLTTLPTGVFEDLVLLEELNLYTNAISSLPAGVFAGLSSLRELNLEENSLTGLPSGLFAGLGALINLNLEENILTVLASDTFEDLVLLEELELSDNDISTLPAGIFATLASLKDLELYDNNISSLLAGTFAGLSALEELELDTNQLTELPAGIFDGLGSLTYLDLDSNSLTTLPAGLFDDLVLLKYLHISSNPDLQCLPETTDPVPSVDDDTILATGICECTPADAVSCEDVTSCTPGQNGYTCGEEECCEDQTLASPTCILEEDLSKALRAVCKNASGCDCASGHCVNSICEGCPEGTDVCSDPHMHGLRGQRIDWSGVDGGWYCLVKDDEFDFHVNVRLTAPLPVDFPDRQLITGLSVVSEEHSFVIEVKSPYTIDTEGCPDGTQVCLANGGLRATVDNEDYGLLRPTRDEVVADGFKMSASNLPVECRQFGGDRIWARMYDEMLQGSRELGSESFEDWVMDFGNMAAPDWCAKYVSERGLDGVQSIHSLVRIETGAISLRLNVGIGYQVGGQLDWDGRVLPDLEFWQMDIGMEGLSLEHESMSGILGETARPVLDGEGVEVMNGYNAFRGTVDDYRVDAATETDFTLLHQMGS